jgi:hypothetical protein
MATIQVNEEAKEALEDAILQVFSVSERDDGMWDVQIEDKDARGFEKMRLASETISDAVLQLFAWRNGRLIPN